MANVPVSGGGIAGVIAAEGLARRLEPAHRITLVSRHPDFTLQTHARYWSRPPALKRIEPAEE
jgi:NADH dehydrogenase FAD-containing subunit